MSARKYHINPETGQPNLCTATVKDCKYSENGETSEHYATQEEARIAYEKSSDKEYGITKTLKRKASSKSLFNNLMNKLKSKKIDYPQADFSKYSKYIIKDNSLDIIRDSYFKSDTKVETPSWSYAKDIGMISVRINESDEILTRSYNYHLEEYAEANYRKSPIMVENFLVRDGQPVAYYSFIAAGKETYDPPMIHTAEVRKEFRGQKLSNYFKKEINKKLKEPLHSNGAYTEAGYRSIDKSPVWEKSPLYKNDSGGRVSIEGYEIFENAGQNTSYIEDWESLATKEWASDW